MAPAPQTVKVLLNLILLNGRVYIFFVGSSNLSMVATIVHETRQGSSENT